MAGGKKEYGKQQETANQPNFYGRFVTNIFADFVEFEKRKKQEKCENNCENILVDDNSGQHDCCESNSR